MTDTLCLGTYHLTSTGHFHWQKHEVFVSEVLWGERIGLLQVGEHRYIIYFAQTPIAAFDSRHAYFLPWNKTTQQLYTTGAEEGDSSPSSALHPLNQPDQKVSAICPV